MGRRIARHPGLRAGSLVLLSTLPMMSLFTLLVSGCTPSTLETERLGSIQLRRAADDPRGLVFLFSGAGGWGPSDDLAATALSDRGAIVVGVDLAAYRVALDASDGECLYLLSEIESVSQQVQRKFGVGRYFSPILAGVGEGGALVMAMLAQSPAATVAGAVAVDPAESVRTVLPLCEGAPAHKTDVGFAYGPLTDLPGFLSIGFSAAADAAERERVERQEGAANVKVAVAKPGQPELPPKSAQESLVELVEAHLARGTSVAGGALPNSLIEMPSAKASDVLVIVMSGDGGWRDLDKTIAGDFQEHGNNVVGWDTLRYFWEAKSPERVAADLDAVIVRYTREWNASVVALVGYSFGADVLPFAYNRLPEASRARVRQMSLLGVSKEADFEFHVTNWLGAGASAAALPLQPELTRVPISIIQCFYGEEEDDTGCPDLAAMGAEVIRTTGEHHFDGDYAALARRILEGLAKRSAAPAGPR